MRKIDGLIPTSYDEAVRALHGKVDRTLNANTRLTRSGMSVEVLLHYTPVVTFRPDGAIVLNSGGWRTTTTKARINAALAGCNFAVFQSKGSWYVSHPRWERVRPFVDGFVIGGAQ